MVVNSFPLVMKYVWVRMSLHDKLRQNVNIGLLKMSDCCSVVGMCYTTTSTLGNWGVVQKNIFCSQQKL